MPLPTADTLMLSMRYRQLVTEEDDALRLLREHNVLKKTMECPGKGGLECKSIMIERRRKNCSNIWRCSDRSCRKELSVRAGCAFFHFKSDNISHKSSIPITQVLEIVWLFLFSQSTVRLATAATGHSSHTIGNWWQMCRQICSATMDKQQKFCGTSDAPIQIDESYFSGRRKYNRGRLQKGDKRRKHEEKEDDNDEDEFEDWGSMHDGAIYNDDSEEWL